MTTLRLITQSLRHYRRTHLGVVLGVVIATAVLTGAMVVGDSVRHSLREMALARLGETHLALVPQDRTYRVELAARLSEKLNAPIAPVLYLPGTASNDAAKKRAGRVQVVGVDATFNRLIRRDSASPEFPPIPPDSVVLNDALAAELGVNTGDSILLRVSKPSLLPRDAPLTRSDLSDMSLAMTVKVAAVIGDPQGGRFSLQANQAAPLNAFVNLAWLQVQLKQEGRANLMLVGAASGGELAVARADEALQQVFQLEDVGIEVRQVLDQPWIELRTDRVFLEDPLVKVAYETGKAFSVTPLGVLTYLVNEMKSGDRSVPYSMVTSLGPIGPVDHRPDDWPESIVPLLPVRHPDEIVVNEWLAEQLGLQAQGGPQSVTMTYFVQGVGGELIEKTSEPFQVVRRVPIAGAAADRTLLPQFPDMPAPGTTFSQWKPSFKLTRRIRPQDDQYWADYGGTPKAYIPYQTGKEIWSNRFGSATAIRFPMENVGGEKTAVSVDSVRRELQGRISPASIGLSFVAVREQAIKASREGFDFAQLFLGFSFFLIVAALLLTGLLFVFTIEQRGTQVGTLLAIGFQPRQVRRLLLMEGFILAVIGAGIGVALGLLYTNGLLHGLRTLWRGAVGTTSLAFHVEPVTLFIGFAASVSVAMLTIWLVLRRQGRLPARELLASGAGSVSNVTIRTKGRGRNAMVTGVMLLLAAIGLLAWTASTGNLRNAGAFFGSGALLLTAGLLLCFTVLTRMLIRGSAGAPSRQGGASTGMPLAASLSIRSLGLRNNARRRGRSLAVIALLACGAFLVIAIGAFWLSPSDDPGDRKSGTGGFTLYAESTLPVLADLNTEAGLNKFALERDDLKDVKFVPMRVRDGDDASCLNLNRAQNPRLVGVTPDLLRDRRAFVFADYRHGLSFTKQDDAGGKSPWALLWELIPPRKSGARIVPAIGDANTITYGLGKGIGDRLEYTDEAGNVFQVEIVATLSNSVLQGSLFIDEREFMGRFPSVSGHRTFLVDAPVAISDTVAGTLEKNLAGVGLEVTTTAARLAMFNQVQNTYLSIFQALGGLGLLLGSVGLGIVVLRNVLERRGELALLGAVGFPRGTLRRMLLSEHTFLLLAGLLCGLVAALVAIIPAANSPGSQPPFALLGAIVAGVFISGLLWTWLACRLALRGSLLASLRGE